MRHSVPPSVETEPGWDGAGWRGVGPSARKGDAQENQRAATELADGHRLAEEDSQPDADEQLEIAESGALSNLQAGQTVATNDEGERRAADVPAFAAGTPRFDRAMKAAQ
ncbi:MAG: hypothetical protein H0W59_03350 [Chloroflexia bacterium]|nr:hypothetical protein [Chloroflexia bacterium]